MFMVISQRQGVSLTPSSKYHHQVHGHPAEIAPTCEPPLQSVPATDSCKTAVFDCCPHCPGKSWTSVSTTPRICRQRFPEVDHPPQLAGASEQRNRRGAHSSLSEVENCWPWIDADRAHQEGASDCVYKSMLCPDRPRPSRNRVQATCRQ